MAEMRPSFQDDIRDSQPYHELYQHCRNHPELWNYIFIKKHLNPKNFQISHFCQNNFGMISIFCLHNICHIRWNDDILQVGKQQLFHQIFTGLIKSDSLMVRLSSSENERF